MIYFKTHTITKYTPAEIESGVRRYSLKRHIRLDFHSSVSYIQGDKYFYGIETTKDVQITRIKTPFERFLPKLIFSFSKKEEFMIYRVRYDYSSMIVFFLLFFSALFNLVDAFTTESLGTATIVIPGLFVIFLALSFLESEITQIRILKAISNSKKEKLTLI